MKKSCWFKIFIFLFILVSLNFISATTTQSYSVKVTNEHPFLLSNGTSVPASELKPGMELMTIDGKRKNVLITRENNGKLEFVRLNLNSDEIFKSPYFYLQQNDVIYVEPNNVKSFGAQNTNLTLYLSAVSTLVTTVAVIYSMTKK